MKTVLLITTEESQRRLYEPILKKHFDLELSAVSRGGSGKVDAIIYDLPKIISPVDLEWLSTFDVPVVILTPDASLGLPSARQQRILTYPVRPQQILQALSEMEVRPDARKAHGAGTLSWGFAAHRRPEYS